MMLDRYDATQDVEFARTSIVPMADVVVTYYNEHWKRGSRWQTALRAGAVT